MTSIAKFNHTINFNNIYKKQHFLQGWRFSPCLDFTMTWTLKLAQTTHTHTHRRVGH